MVYNAVVVALLACSNLAASASLHAHNHRDLHKRGVEGYWPKPSPEEAPAPACVVKTYTSTWFGTPGLVPQASTQVPPPASSSAAPPPAPPAPSAPASSQAPPPPPSSAAAPPPAPPTETKPVQKPAAPPVASKPEGGSWQIPGLPGLPKGPIPVPSIPHPPKGPSGGGSGGITPNGNQWAMTYTPYTSGGSCKSASDVNSDISSIKAKGFTTVRLYATDCSGVQNVGAACKEHGMKMIMGIYIDASGLGMAHAQLGELTAWGVANGWDNVEMVVAGNEAVFNGYCSASDLAGFIGTVKTTFSAAGYTGPVTTTEPVGTIQQNAATFCGAVDVIAANIHPFFNGGVSASGAGDFVKSQLDLIHAACNGEKEAYNLETGWPSQGNANGAAIPGVAEQKTAVDSIIAALGSKSAIFSFENDSWKAPGDLGVEQYWGCSSLFSG